MKAIPVLRTTDADSTCAWFGRFGFSEDWRWRGEPEGPTTASISCPGGATLYIAEGRANDMDSASPSEIYLIVLNIDVISTALGTTPELMPWGDREVRVRVPDGNYVTFSQPTTQ